MVDRISKRSALITAFLLITLITLVAGLLPRGNFEKNWVEVDKSNNATRIGEYGYAVGQFGEITNHSTGNTVTRIDLKITMHEQMDATFRALVYAGRNCKSNPFIIGQWRTHLIVTQGCDSPSKSAQLSLSTNMAPYLGTSTSVSILLGNPDNEIRVNNTLVVKKAGTVYYPTGATDSSIIIGNTPDGQRGWSGSISSLSITQSSADNLFSKTIRDYQFDAYDGSDTIVDASAEKQSLRVPWPGRFPEQIRLAATPTKSLFTTQKFDALINLIGFIPMGFISALVLYTIFGVTNRGLLISSVLLACTVSLSIELSQVYIAGRKSNLHDLVLNATGAWFGYLMHAGIDVYKRTRSANRSTQSSVD